MCLFVEVYVPMCVLLHKSEGEEDMATVCTGSNPYPSLTYPVQFPVWGKMVQLHILYVIHIQDIWLPVRECGTKYRKCLVAHTTCHLGSGYLTIIEYGSKYSSTVIAACEV